MTDMLKAAKAAKAEVSRLTTAQKNIALEAMADALLSCEAAILEANRADMEKAAATISPVMLDRLKLTPERIEGMAKGICEQMPFEVRQPSVIMRSTRRAASAILASPSATVLSS